MRRNLPLILLPVALATLATSAQANMFTYTANLSNNGEPFSTSDGTGSATVIVDDVANTMNINLNFTDLAAPSLFAQIEGPTGSPTNGIAATEQFPSFPFLVTTGTYTNTFDLTDPTTYDPGFFAANGATIPLVEAAFISDLNSGTMYLDIYTASDVPAGDIGGFLTPASGAAPEPVSAIFTLTLLASAGALIRRPRGN